MYPESDLLRLGRTPCHAYGFSKIGSRAAMKRPISKEAVAAGEGALQMCTEFCSWMMRKSSTMPPSGTQCLSTDTGFAGNQIFLSDFRDEPLETTHEGFLAK